MPGKGGKIALAVAEHRFVAHRTGFTLKCGLHQEARMETAAFKMKS